MIPGKVAALITRRIGDRTEVCVFDHAGNVQLPAGTMEVGEAPDAGAAREAWEETGLPRLEVVDEVATLGEFDLDEDPRTAMMMAPHGGCPITPGHAVVVLERIGTTATIHSAYFGWTGDVDAGCVTRDVTRHVFHLRAAPPVPDEWWVLTPDGDGSQWRCRWIPLDDRTQVHPKQQRWLDAGRAAIDPGPPVERAAPLPPGATELYDAHNEVRLVMTPVERAPREAQRGSSYGVCVTAAGDTVLVNEDGRPAWGLPGGRPEPGETAETTLVREVLEEACATVVECERLLTSEDVFLDDERAVVGRFDTSIFWARVELDEWTPRFEKTGRRVVPLPSLAAELRWKLPMYVRIHDLALAAEARRR